MVPAAARGVHVICTELTLSAMARASNRHVFHSKAVSSFKGQ